MVFNVLDKALILKFTFACRRLWEHSPQLLSVRVRFADRTDTVLRNEYEPVFPKKVLL